MKGLQDIMPIKDVLQLALGTPSDGCVNFKMLLACLERILMFIGGEKLLVNVVDWTGVRTGGEAEIGAKKFIESEAVGGEDRNRGDALNDLWDYMQIKKEVEAHRIGLDFLFRSLGHLLEGKEGVHIDKYVIKGDKGSDLPNRNYVTWAALGEQLHAVMARIGSTKEAVEDAMLGMEKAKAYTKDDAKKRRLDTCQTQLDDRFRYLRDVVGKDPDFDPRALLYGLSAGITSMETLEGANVNARPKANNPIKADMKSVKFTEDNISFYSTDFEGHSSLTGQTEESSDAIPDANNPTNGNADTKALETTKENRSLNSKDARKDGENENPSGKMCECTNCNKNDKMN